MKQQEFNFCQPSTIKGEYKLRVLNADRSVKHETEWFDNLITNGGLDRLAQGQIGQYCRIGTGNTAPANTDTQLVSQSAFTSTIAAGAAYANAGSPTYAATRTEIYEFALGAVVGNMAEVGIGWTTTGSGLFSRALIVDGGGTPTTITVLITEILQVVYRLTIYQATADVSAVVDISGTSTTIVLRPALIASAWNFSPQRGSISYFTSTLFAGNAYGSYSWVSTSTTLGAITASGPVGGTTGIVGTSGAWLTYTPGNYYRDYSVNWLIGEGNIAGGIATAVFRWADGNISGDIAWQMSFSPAVAKDATKTFALVVRHTWARH